MCSADDDKNKLEEFQFNITSINTLIRNYICFRNKVLSGKRLRKSVGMYIILLVTITTEEVLFSQLLVFPCDSLIMQKLRADFNERWWRGRERAKEGHDAHGRHFLVEGLHPQSVYTFTHNH